MILASFFSVNSEKMITTKARDKRIAQNGHDSITVYHEMSARLWRPHHYANICLLITKNIYTTI